MNNYFPDRNQSPKLNLFPGVVARTCWGERLMLSYVDLAPHSVVEEHQHPHEQLGIMLEGSLELTIGDETRLIHAGDVYTIPPNLPHGARTLDEGCVVLDVFTPPRADYGKTQTPTSTTQ